MAYDGFDAVVYSGQKEGAAVAVGGDVVVGDEAEAGGVDVGDAGKVEDENLRGEGAELVLEGEHGGERERPRQG